MDVKNLTIEQKIGQCLVGGFPSTRMSDEFIECVKKYKIGNVILFRENMESLPQLSQLCRDIQNLIMQETGIPAFITTDQEGGAVVRLPECAANVPGAMALAATAHPENAYAAGLLTGRQLRNVGINFNLAPCLDVNSNPDNPVIGVRSYGDTPETVSAFGIEMIRGLKDGGVLCAAKHFPGHGNTGTDSHVTLPSVNRDTERLNCVDLLPFKNAVAAGIPAIMTSHILFPALEPERIPATMSRRIVTGLLRDELGFTGLIISDCMEMSAIKKFYGTVNGTAEALKAGVDMVFVSHSAALLSEAARNAKYLIGCGFLDEAEMDRRVSRIVQFKKLFRAGETLCADFDREAAVSECRRLRRASVTEVHVPPKGRPALGAHPLCLGCASYITSMVGNILEDVTESFPVMLSRLLNCAAVQTSVQPDDREIERIVKTAWKHSCVIFGSYNAHLRPRQLKLMHALVAGGVPLAVVALRDPYDLRGLPDQVYTIAAYEYTASVVQDIADVFTGKLTPSGVLPIRLERYVAGCDGGGTKTRIEVRNLDGKILAKNVFGPININGNGLSAVKKSIGDCIGFLRSMQGGLQSCDCLCLGCAGVSNEEERSFLRDVLSESGYRGKLVIASDAEVALAGAVGTESGAVLISGTGSICMGRRDDGETYRSGGCGCIIDDEGSGYAIGRDVLKAVVRASDGRSEPTVLTEKVLSFLQIDRIDDIVKFVHSLSADKKRIAELSALCASAADENDSVAISILTKAAEELSFLVIPVLRKLNLPKGPLVLTGSVLQKDRIVPVKLKSILARTFPELEYAKAPGNAAVGAVLLALRSVSVLPY